MSEATSEPEAPGYGFEIFPHRGRVTAWHGGTKLAETKRALRLTETRLPDVYYFPRTDVRMDLLTPSDLHTHCPFRGNASYWSLGTPASQSENVAWSYEEPFFDARRIKGYVAFYADRIDKLLVDKAAPDAPPTPLEYYANPLVDWVLRVAPDATSIRELIEQFADVMLDAGIPLWRIWLNVPTLHPLLSAFSYTWETDSEATIERQVDHDVTRNDAFLNSPVRTIFEGAGGVRCRLEGPNPQLDYPIVKEHYEAGATDYVAMPLVFSDGQINAVSLTSKQAGGFSTRDLGFIYEVLPVLSRMIEVHATKRTSVQLLRTYLGRHTGERVLNGHVTRGDGERIHAVIWFCDLRDSTGLAERLPADEFLELLNQFYDCLAGPVLDHGGEVLRFIGDAALAIFPFGPSSDETPDSSAREAAQVCSRALDAAVDARARMASQNASRSAAGQPPLGYGIALHVGDVTYGNIGTAERLEFTVVGSAANEAARIETMTKTLGHQILISERFAAISKDDRYRSVGRHELRGLTDKQEIFALESPKRL